MSPEPDTDNPEFDAEAGIEREPGQPEQGEAQEVPSFEFADAVQQQHQEQLSARGAEIKTESQDMIAGGDFGDDADDLYSEIAEEDELIEAVIEETEDEAKGLLVSEAVKQFNDPETPDFERIGLAVYAVSKSPETILDLNIDGSEMKDILLGVARQNPENARAAYQQALSVSFAGKVEQADRRMREMLNQASEQGDAGTAAHIQRKMELLRKNSESFFERSEQQDRAADAWRLATENPGDIAAIARMTDIDTSLLFSIVSTVEIPKNLHSHILEFVIEKNPKEIARFAGELRVSGSELMNVIRNSPEEVQDALFDALKIGKSKNVNEAMMFYAEEMEKTEEEKAAAKKAEQIVAQIKENNPDDSKKVIKEINKQIREATKNRDHELINALQDQLDMETASQEEEKSRETEMAKKLEAAARETSDLIIEHLKRKITEARESGDDELSERLSTQLALERKRREEEKQLNGKRFKVTDMNGGVNASKVLHFSTAEGRKVKPCVYKPIRGEQSARMGIETGGGYKREWLASQIDRILGLNIVPTTIVRDGPNGIGSAQMWEIGRLGEDVIEESDDIMDEVKADDMHAISFLDSVMRNTDRHNNNFLIAPDGKIWAIDNGFSLSKNKFDGVRSEPRMILKNQNAEIPQFIKDKIAAFFENSALQEQLKKCFEAALDKDGAKMFEIFMTRMKIVQAAEEYTELEMELDASDKESMKFK